MIFDPQYQRPDFLCVGQRLDFILRLSFAEIKLFVITI